MKRIISLILLAVLTLTMLASCNQDGSDASADESSKSNAVSTVKEPDFNTLCEQARSACEFPSDRADYGPVDLDDYFGISADIYTKAFYSVDTGTTVETIALFIAKDAECAETLKQKMNNRINAYLNEQEDYDEKNYHMAENGVVSVKGNYVYLIVSTNKDAVQKIFDEAIG